MLIVMLIVMFIVIVGAVKETFMPANVFEVDDNNIKSMFDTETVDLDTIFDTFNKSNLPDYRNTFLPYPIYMKFPLTSTLNEALMNTIKSAFQSTKYKEDKIEFIRGIHDLYWKDIGTTRHFIYNIDLNNRNKAFTRKLRVYLLINNFDRFLTDTGEISPLAPSTLQVSDVRVLYVGTDNIINHFQFPGSPQPSNIPTFHNYYRIRNNLYLMDPYITNRKDMLITDEMKDEFAKKVEGKRLYQLGKVRDGSCFNSTNNAALTKEECIDSFGTWDYPPLDHVECPYYTANQNYPNVFGSIKNGKCELPMNMQVIGYRNYSNNLEFAPLCYNCKNKTIGQGTLGNCCDEQENKKVYPHLITPDYAFIGDKLHRAKYQQLFDANGLSVV